MSDKLDAISYPELVIGIAGPIGIDTDQIVGSLAHALSAVGYRTEAIKLTDEMREFRVNVPALAESDYFSRITHKIDFANQLRREWDDTAALARIGVRAIRTRRAELTGDPEVVSERTAYILSQLKRPEEVRLLRTVYGRQFVLVSAYGSAAQRKGLLEKKLRSSLPTQTQGHEVSCKADDLIERDASEEGQLFGQELRETFHLADVFVDGIKKPETERMLDRFVQAFFGRTDITPSKHEYGMYAAKSASLRSADLSRQVGAAIFTEHGELVTQGCNEVPKAFGGTYWDSEEPDHRDVRLGGDPNDLFKKEILRDLLERLASKGLLSERATNLGPPGEMADALTKKAASADEENGALVGAAVLDLTEYGRVVHAEMCAICDAARLGKSVKGAMLFCTTFPCHNCTKHILAAGITRVIYMEPYPKSKAKDLHENEIDIEEENPGRVSFLPFLGVSPYRYRDIFQKGRRKNKDGSAKRWLHETARPMLDVVAPSYLDVEAMALVPLLGDIRAQAPDGGQSDPGPGAEGLAN